MYKYVDEQAIVRESEDKKIMAKTDEQFITDNGIVEVSEDRWREAQRYEYGEWMVRGLQAQDDRNELHAENFNQYRDIKKGNIKSAIELGCGPFTNMRLIYSKLNLPVSTSITLLDPLADEYMNHPHCTYRDKWTMWNPPTIINSSIERFDVKTQYDLVVMINVLEHCKSIPTILDKVVEMTAPGGWFVFSDVYFQKEVITDLAGHTFNAGHPIRLEARYILDWMWTNFYGYHETHLDEKVAGRDAREVYFIGTKR